ncbi:Histidine kinase osmosensor [Marasmius crinis-equi]|uniref:Histidine kinase osmosensor n=1 Tax=Marasmius crinis-equi TaxID=585013 RepID=A0ABR3FJT7_9AGAR
MSTITTSSPPPRLPLPPREFPPPEPDFDTPASWVTALDFDIDTDMGEDLESMTSNTTPTDHAETETFLEHLDRLVSYYDAPSANAVSVPSWLNKSFEDSADWRMSSILRSMKSVVGRMMRAEGALRESGLRVPAKEEGDEEWPSPVWKQTATAAATKRSSTSRSGLKLGDLPSHRAYPGSRSTSASGSAWRNSHSLSKTPFSHPHDVDYLSHKHGHPYPSASPHRPQVNEEEEHQNAIEEREKYFIRNTTNSGPSVSAPPTSHIDYGVCPRCLNRVTDAFSASRILDFGAGTPGSPLVVASGGALATAAMESGLSAVEELRLLKAQVQDVARVCKAVADGDLTQKITVPVQGVVMVTLKDVINTMVDKLGQFAKEVTRVSQEVGTEGKLGGQALVLDVEGTWRELTGVVNKLAANLTSQVRSIAKVTKAVALGDLSKQIEVDARGEILDLKNTVNGMVVRLRALAAEVTRVTLEVGSQGKLGGQANVPDVEGVWFELVRNVNRMCSSITDQVRSIAIVTTAVAGGDLTQKIEIQVEGEMATLKKTVNNMVDQLGAFASEVTRVALEVGTQGILGGQARVEGVQGTWADLTRNVNSKKSKGKGSKKDRENDNDGAASATERRSSKLDLRERWEVKDSWKLVGEPSNQRDPSTPAHRPPRSPASTGSFVAGRYDYWSFETALQSPPTYPNRVTDAFSASRILDFGAGTPGSPLVVASGGALATAAMDAMESGLSAVEELRLLKARVQDVARVCKAVADGDLTQKITVPVQGVVMVTLKDVINTMVDKLGQFAKEVTRVSQEVGTEGKLGGQALVLDVEGTWRELTGAVNKLAANLTSQVRSIAKVTKAVALGDLSKQIEVDARGEILDLKNTVNGMVVRLRALAAEVTRVTLEVGSQGKLGGQANVPDVEGVWFELVRNVNRMCSSITDQVRSIAIVTTAVAGGDLTQKIEIQVEGEMATLKKTVNNMVDQLGAFASEVTRVALEVGTQGILGGQARVEGVQGTWVDLTRNINKMASNLTNQGRSISEVTKAVAQGKLASLWKMLDLKETVNSMVVQLSTFSNEVTRVSLEVGTEGILGGQAFVPDVQGEWKSLTDNVNLMAMNLTNQVRSIAEVTKAVASGDLSKKIVVDVKGEIADLKETVNEMTESLSVFADEVTRVAREVGTEGKLGGQARVANVAGTWKALTDNVNVMAKNLTLQVRTIAVATTAVARGDLTQKIGGVSVSGEMLNLVNTINDMIDQLSIFAVEVKKVAREVGTEGKLGVQAEVGNVQGIWQEITLSVNTMAGNLTTQVRGFAQISAAAMDGDFTRFITVEASGEMDSLKTQINNMVFNLRDSIQKNPAAREAAELANTSHEIRWALLWMQRLEYAADVWWYRTPMNGIIGMTDLTLDSDLKRDN